MIQRVLIFCLSFSFYTVKGQTKKNENRISAMMEFILDKYGEADEINLEDQRTEEYWLELIKHPARINQMNEQELSKALPLNPLQIEAFIQYRTMAGPLIDVHELQIVPGWSHAFIKLLQPFISTESPKEIKEYVEEIFETGRHQLEIRASHLLQKPAGYETDRGSEERFLGERLMRQLKYGYADGKQLRFGLIGELDAGEQFRVDKKTKGFDYWGYYFSVQVNLRYLTKLVLGDYTVCVGKGLMLWQGFGANKGTDVMNIKNQKQGIESYRSFSENWSMRGIGLEGKIGRKEWMIFFSKKGVDGQIIEADTLSNEENYRSIITGLHRTEKEMATKGKIKTYTYGYSFQHSGKNLKCGFSQIFSQTSVKPNKGTDWYQKYELQKMHHSNFGIDFSFQLKGTHIFGEMAMDQQRNSAMHFGTLSALSKEVSVSTYFRNLHPGFQSIAGSIANEYGAIKNERGFFVGLQIRPKDKISCNFYVDFFKSPWLRYQLNAPTFGREVMLHVQYTPTKKSSLTLRVKEEHKPQHISFENGGGIGAWAFLMKMNFRIQYRVELSENSTFTCRVERQQAKEENNRGESKQGSLIYLNYKKRVFKNKLTLNMWTGYANVESSEAAVFYFEPDPVVGTVKMVSAYKNEVNWGISGTYIFLKRLKVSFKITENRYKKEQVFGSGLDKWVGRNKTEMAIKLVYGLH